MNYRIFKKYQKFWVKESSFANKISNKSSKSVLSSFLEPSSNIRLLCQTLLSDDDRRLMNDIIIDDVMEMILNYSSTTKLQNKLSISTDKSILAYERLVELYEEGKLDVNGYLKDGSTPLYIFIKHDYLNCVRMLLQHDANPNFIHRQLGHSPLHLAAMKGSYQCISELIQAGANITYINTIGSHRSVLHYAAECSSIQCLHKLLDPFQSHGNATSLQYNTINHQIKQVIDAPDIHGLTALHLACIDGNVDCVSLLLKHGANIYFKNGAGMSTVDITKSMYCNSNSKSNSNSNTIGSSMVFVVFVAAGLDPMELPPPPFLEEETTSAQDVTVFVVDDNDSETHNHNHYTQDNQLLNYSNNKSIETSKATTSEHLINLEDTDNQPQLLLHSTVNYSLHTWGSSSSGVQNKNKSTTATSNSSVMNGNTNSNSNSTAKDLNTITASNRSSSTVIDINNNMSVEDTITASTWWVVIKNGYFATKHDLLTNNTVDTTKSTTTITSNPNLSKSLSSYFLSNHTNTTMATNKTNAIPNLSTTTSMINNEDKVVIFQSREEAMYQISIYHKNKRKSSSTLVVHNSVNNNSSSINSSNMIKNNSSNNIKHISSTTTASSSNGYLSFFKSIQSRRPSNNNNSNNNNNNNSNSNSNYNNNNNNNNSDNSTCDNNNSDNSTSGYTMNTTIGNTIVDSTNNNNNNTQRRSHSSVAFGFNKNQQPCFPHIINSTKTSHLYLNRSQQQQQQQPHNSNSSSDNSGDGEDIFETANIDEKMKQRFIIEVPYVLYSTILATTNQQTTTPITISEIELSNHCKIPLNDNNVNSPSVEDEEIDPMWARYKRSQLQQLIATTTTAAMANKSSSSTHISTHTTMYNMTIIRKQEPSSSSYNNNNNNSINNNSNSQVEIDIVSQDDPMIVIAEKAKQQLEEEKEEIKQLKNEIIQQNNEIFEKLCQIESLQQSFSFNNNIS